jgi:uncharacterized repeat protein (TIGR03803 family)
MRRHSLLLGESFRTLVSTRAVLAVVIAVALAAAPGTWAQPKYKTLHEFTGGMDGAYSTAGLILDAQGNLYGTTTRGGSFDGGSVFRLTPRADGSWAETMLYNFCSATNCADGFNPDGGLVFDQTGHLYGVTLYGGVFRGGTVFQLTPRADGRWTETVLYNFCPANNCADGLNPVGGLIFDQIGTLYGATFSGGLHQAGVIFRLAPKGDGRWTETVLYNFCSIAHCRDGAGPYASLVLGQSGSLYGTTLDGGSPRCGCGVVFQLAPKPDGTWAQTVLHHFSIGGIDGNYPLAGLIFDTAGNLYGATNGGGVNQRGTVFELQPKQRAQWREKILHSFTGGGDGSGPFAALVFDQAGNLYGTTQQGGDLKSRCNNGCGVVFKLRPRPDGTWVETVLHGFHRRPGAYPEGGILFDGVGNLYGTTYGYASTGSVYEITP